MEKQYPHLESKVNHKLATEVWFALWECYVELSLDRPLR